jgi:hypothetical protein
MGATGNLAHSAFLQWRGEPSDNGCAISCVAKAIAINATPRPVQWWQSFAEKGRAKHSDGRDALFSIGAPATSPTFRARKWQLQDTSVTSPDRTGKSNDGDRCEDDMMYILVSCSNENGNSGKFCACRSEALHTAPQ